MLVRVCVIAVLAVAGCEEPRRLTEPDVESLRVEPPRVEPPGVELTRPRAVSTEVAALLDRFECNRCHQVPAAPAEAVRDKHCFRCHQQIHEDAFEARPDTLAKWQGRIRSLRHAPSLVNADRLQRGWVTQFLRHPHDLRPGSVAQMPRLALTEAEAGTLARWLVPEETAPSAPHDPSLVARGAQLYRDLACGRCHRFTGASVDDAALHAAGRVDDAAIRNARANTPAARGAATPGGATSDTLVAQQVGWTLAPDLRFARERMQPGRLAAWIEDPRGAMPKLAGITAAHARALAAYIATTPLAPRAPREPPRRLPILAREVTWAEVSGAVFRDTCWHCHAVPDLARGDGGPGNSGGFGFPGRGLDLSSYTGISQGSIRDGERASIFAKLPDGTPRVVAHLMARHVEEAGGEVEGIRGMPLGLPALTLAQIQLVETWIAQGRPQ